MTGLCPNQLQPVMTGLCPNQLRLVISGPVQLFLVLEERLTGYGLCYFSESQLTGPDWTFKHYPW